MSNELSDLYDDYHIDNLYCVSLFCYNRFDSKVLLGESLLQPPSQLIIRIAQNYCQITFQSVITDLKYQYLSVTIRVN